MQLYIGQTSFKGSFSNYAQRLNFLELLAEPHRLPKLSRLAQYKASAPEGFVFSVVLSAAAAQPGQAGQQAVSFGVKVWQALGARWLVLRTPSSVRPSAASERQVSQVVDQLVAAGVPKPAIAWEARGLWSGASLVQAAARLGVVPVVDARDAKPSEVAYARLLRLGVGARTNTRLTEKLALAFLQSGEAYLAVDGGSALALKREFEELIDELAAGEDDLEEALDEELDEPDAAEPDAAESDDASDDDRDDDDGDLDDDDDGSDWDDEPWEQDEDSDDEDSDDGDSDEEAK